MQPVATSHNPLALQLFPGRKQLLPSKQLALFHLGSEICTWKSLFWQGRKYFISQQKLMSFLSPFGYIPPAYLLQILTQSIAANQISRGVILPAKKGDPSLPPSIRCCAKLLTVFQGSKMPESKTLMYTQSYTHPTPNIHAALAWHRQGLGARTTHVRDLASSFQGHLLRS